MSNLPVVVLVDPNTVVKNRIRNILANQDITIYEASNRQEMLHVLSENDYKIDLVITDIEIDTKNSFDGISLIKLIKSKSDSIPVVVLTSISKKEVIMRCLLEGSADYILKPFEDDYLKEKLLRYINIESLTEYTVLRFNLNNYLCSEIHKAQKGNYHFSLLLVNFHTNFEDDPSSATNSFYKYAELIYKDLKSLFWDSDLYIQHGFHSHLGFFPFCDEANTLVIRAKISAKFDQLKSINPSLLNFSMDFTSSTYPMDGGTASELLHILNARATQKEESGKESGEESEIEKVENSGIDNA